MSVACREWRYTVIPEEPCVFCEIVARRSPAEIVCTWPHATAFIPLDPVTPGHTLVVPNEHVANAVVHPVVTAMVMQRAAELASEYPYSNILTNTGTPAKQNVFHLHIHVIPRSAGDQLMLPWGTTGNPHDPHWCGVAEGLQRQIDALVNQSERCDMIVADSERRHSVAIGPSDRDELALAIAHPKHSPTGMVTDPMPDECGRCVGALLAADRLIAAGWRPTVALPEREETTT